MHNFERKIILTLKKKLLKTNNQCLGIQDLMYLFKLMKMRRV